LALVHWAAAWNLITPRRTVTRLLYVMSVFWAANFCALVTKQVRRLRRARKLKVPVPWFSGTGLDPTFGTLAASAVSLVVGITCCAGFVAHIVYLMRSGADWLSIQGLRKGGGYFIRKPGAGYCLGVASSLRN
jgi:hypothetical protein